MRKISIFCVLSFLLSILAPCAYASNTDEGVNNIDEYVTSAYSFVNDYDQNITVVIYTKDDNVRTEVYINDILTQESSLSSSDMIVHTVLYDGYESSSDEVDNAEADWVQDDTNENDSASGYQVETTHLPMSDITISDDITIDTIVESVVTPDVVPATDSNLDVAYIEPENSSDMLVDTSAEASADMLASAFSDEPVDNTGLTASGYSDGYYTLGSAKFTYSSARGYLYRKYGTSYAGETSTWKFDAGTALSAIITYVEAVATGGSSAVLSVLFFTAENVLAYSAATKLETLKFTYNYRVRIDSGNMGIYFTPQRVKTYWKATNSSAQKVNYTQKSSDGGNAGSNSDFVRAGIDNYLEYHFSDTWSHWAKNNIAWAYKSGYVTGVTSTTFCPENSLTRGQFLAILYRYAGSPNAFGTIPFTDVSTNSYYYRAIRWAYHAGIASGTTTTTFSPNDTLTREQMVTFLFRYAKYYGEDTSARANLNKFSDSGSVSKFAQDAVKWAIAKGILTGVTSTTLRPGSIATRAAGVTILYRYNSVY